MDTHPTDQQIAQLDEQVQAIAKHLPPTASVEADLGGIDSFVIKLAPNGNDDDPYYRASLDLTTTPAVWMIDDGADVVIGSSYGPDAAPADVAQWINTEADLSFGLPGYTANYEPIPFDDEIPEELSRDPLTAGEQALAEIREAIRVSSLGQATPVSTASTAQPLGMTRHSEYPDPVDTLHTYSRNPSHGR